MGAHAEWNWRHPAYPNPKMLPWQRSNHDIPTSQRWLTVMHEQDEVAGVAAFEICSFIVTGTATTVTTNK